jgi:transposase
MMGRQKVDQSQLFYLFNLESRIPARHLLRRINPMVTRILANIRERLEPFYSEIGRPSIDPETHDPDADRRLLLRHPV